MYPLPYTGIGKYSLNHAECSLNHTECSLNHHHQLLALHNSCRFHVRLAGDDPIAAHRNGEELANVGVGPKAVDVVNELRLLQIKCTFDPCVVLNTQ